MVLPDQDRCRAGSGVAAWTNVSICRMSCSGEQGPVGRVAERVGDAGGGVALADDLDVVRSDQGRVGHAAGARQRQELRAEDR